MRTNRCVVHRAEKPEFVWWPLPMPRGFCTRSATEHSNGIPHEHSCAAQRCRSPFRRSGKTLAVLARVLVALVSCVEPASSPSGVTGADRGELSDLCLAVQSRFSKLQLRQPPHPKALITHIAAGTFPIPWETSGVGFVQQSSKSPQSLSIWSHTSFQRPTRLKGQRSILRRCVLPTS